MDSLSRVLRLSYTLAGFFRGAGCGAKELEPLQLLPPTEPGRTRDLARLLVASICRGLEQPYGANAMDHMTKRARGHLRDLLAQAYNAGKADGVRGERESTASERYLGEKP